ncbi:HNH endonuclease [Priestia aryabhattai]|uniref:HNH endonuclease n=1 Tax=Priestia aryabhattai TaxID=412384 RepID=UPI0039A0E587
MPKRVNIRFAIEAFWNRGYILYEDKFINAKTKMKYNCMKHPELDLEITWSDFKSGRGCKHCRNDAMRKARQKSIEEVKEIFKSKSLILLSTEYKNNKSDLKFYCENHEGVIQHTTLDKVNIADRPCRLCSIEHLSERQRGDKSHRWKGGVRDEKLALRETFEYKKWRKAVFERDCYTCQKCNDSKGGNLHAHHIYPFYLYEELRHEITNGITLCANCHDSRYKGSFHNIYGTHNNTKEQLEEFLGKQLDSTIGGS